MVSQFFNGYEEGSLTGGVESVGLIPKFGGLAAGRFCQQYDAPMLTQLGPSEPSAQLPAPNLANLRR